MILMTAGLADAEADVRTGKAADAERKLSALHDQAKRDGYTVFELEARLLMSQAEIELGKSAAAHARLDKLESDGRSKGFLLIARKAQVESHH
jgi:thioredoxin-like negative regulator of GroEL